MKNSSTCSRASTRRNHYYQVQDAEYKNNKRPSHRDDRSMEEEIIMSHEKGENTVSWFSTQRRSRRRRRRRKMIHEIPNDDILEEIMVRLPVKTLIVFQTVSKHWRSMITSSFFRERYRLHQKTKEPKFLCLYDDNDWYCTHTAHKTMRLEWSSTCLVEEGEEEDHIRHEHKEGVTALESVFSDSLDGLFCIYGDLTRPIKIINPATRWYQTLPLARIQLDHSLEDNNENVEFSHPVFGKDYVTGTYKLVWLHNIINDNMNTSSVCDVFDFEAKKWRQVIPPHDRITNLRAPTFANGWIYWFSQEKTKLVAFDLHMEVFQIVPNPIAEASSSGYMDMGSIDDDRRLMWISETKGDDGMQHVYWRVTNHNTGGALLKVDKLFSFNLNNKITSTFNLNNEMTSTTSSLRIMAVSKNGESKVMLSTPNCEKLILFQPQPLNTSAINLDRMFSYSPPPGPSGSRLLLPYFPSLASPGFKSSKWL